MSHLLGRHCIHTVALGLGHPYNYNYYLVQEKIYNSLFLYLGLISI